MQFGASRLGFWWKEPPTAGAGVPLAGACDAIPVYAPSSSDGYTLSQLGTPSPGWATKYVIANGYIRYTVNGGIYQGQIGDGSSGIGIQFSPAGDGNYGTDDYIRPGTPFEGYGFRIIKGGTENWIGGTNSNTFSGTGYNTGLTQNSIWNKSAGNLNHIIVLRGSTVLGHAVIQYQTYSGESLIRIKMSYTNTTGQSVTVKCHRGCDPDVGAIQYGVYNTTNYRGYLSIPPQDIVVAEENRTNKPIALYCPGNGFTHNTAVISAWPSREVDTILSGLNNGNGDYSINCAWDLGTFAPGETKAVCCYYILGNNIAEVLSTIT